ncbi:outer membrane protein assembly factor BamB family protein [Thermococcus barossii]|uniref:Pyrrolo-quinoline quinone repeat domain-containing protein n=1 Tax=Thermococcus barossii TaxID=54077 RepID=A0A2Z2MG27_9EURY|nr:PQQ-binding-like beta-propeller repeat protein [Thermococcus barossii]ASJ04459.1 hypothetical protein A3L01_03435 [Thermococcus barossii]
MRWPLPFILILLTLTLVSAQPNWEWTYHDECIVFSMAFNDRGDLALGFGYDAILLNPNGSREFKAPVRGFAYSIAISENGTVIVGTDGNWVQFFDSGGRLLREYKTENVVYSVDISRDGRKAVAGNVDGFVYFFKDIKPVWKRSIGSYLWSVALVGDRILVGGDEGRFVAFGDDGNPIFNLTLPGEVKKVAGDGEMAVALVVSPDETWSSVYAFDWNGKELWEKTFDGLIRDMEFDGKGIALGGSLNEVILLDREGNVVYSVPFYLLVTDVATAEGYTLATGGDEAVLVAPNGTVLWDYSPNETVEKVAISPGARYLALSRRFHGKDICEANVDFMSLGEHESSTAPEVPPRRELGSPLVAAGLGAFILLVLALLWREMRE